MQNDMRDRLIDLLINADVYDSYECKRCTKEDYCDYCNAEKLADHLIKNGVVPVVRCKVCKHCDHFYPRCDKDGTLEEMYSCMMFDYIVQPDCYCSYGERK